MNLTIDANTVILICSQAVTLLVLVLTVKNSITVMTKKIEDNEEHIVDLYEKNTALCKEVGIIQGQIQ